MTNIVILGTVIDIKYIRYYCVNTKEVYHLIYENDTTVADVAKATKYISKNMRQLIELGLKIMS